MHRRGGSRSKGCGGRALPRKIPAKECAPVRVPGISELKFLGKRRIKKENNVKLKKKGQNREKKG